MLHRHRARDVPDHPGSYTVRVQKPLPVLGRPGRQRVDDR